MDEQMELARSLEGKLVQFAHIATQHLNKAQPGGILVARVTESGMVELEGWAGRFDPSLFVVVEEGAG